MRNYHLYIIISLFLGYAVSLHSQTENVWNPNNGDGTFTNPILWGDWPDPDIIRVGDTFYLTTTSMHYLPGCPIATSKDLVNWRITGYAVERYDEDPRYDMQEGTLYLNGAWATSIRHHNGKFYVAFCTPGGWGIDKGHFSICEATDVRGPWKRTIFPEYMYDPGLFFDDDSRVYVVFGQGTLYVTELNSDVHSVKGKPVKVWEHRFVNRNTFGRGFGLEGSHMYKINGYYYITCACGGTEGWQVCLRSKNIYGPYEYKIIVDDDSSYPGNGLHQGGMVQLKNGDWWFAIMQDRGPIGRATHLLPVCWQDGWPMLGVNGKDAITYPLPETGYSGPNQSPATSDEFSEKRLGLQWQWNHNPDDNHWSLTERPGYLRLHPLMAGSLKNSRNTLTQRVQGPSSQATVEIDISNLRDGNVAGEGVFEFPYAYIAVQQHSGRKSLIVSLNDSITETPIQNLSAKRVWIRSRVNDKDLCARFSYSTDGHNFYPVQTVMKMGLGFPWTANRFALFCFTTQKEGLQGYADFNWFHFSNK